MAFGAPLVGRSVELERLADGLTGKSDERTLLLVGEAGIGKSRLLAEAAQQVTGAGVLVLHAGCLSLTETLPLLPVAEALRGLSHHDQAGSLLDLLNSRPAYVRQEIARLLPELSPTPDDADSGPGAGWRRERLFAAVREILAAGAARGPIAVVIEDLHWADPSTLDLLQFLISSPQTDPVHIALSCRSDEPVAGSAFEAWLAGTRSAPGVTEIALGPLDPEHAAQQATELAGRPLASETLMGLYRRAGGNPFFTEQLIAAGLAPAEEGKSTMAATMPPGLALLLGTRVRKVSQPARQVLAALAVAGRPIDEEALVATVDLGYIVVADAIIELTEAQLVSRDNDLYRPRHQLLADVVSSDLPPSRRRALHGRFATALATRRGAQAAAEVAEHWAAASQDTHELASRATAAEAAEALYAYAEAAEHWERITQLWEAAETKPSGLRLVDAYIRAIDDRINLSDSAGARLLTDEALERVGAVGEPYDRAVLLNRSSIFLRLESMEASLLAVLEAVGLFWTQPPSKEKAFALRRAGALLDITGRTDEAENAIDEGLRVARAVGSHDEEAAALTDLARHELLGGDWQSGLSTLAQASALVTESRDAPTLLWIAVHETDVLLRTGRLQQAVDSGERALERTRSLGGSSIPDAAIVTANVAEALLGLGEVALAGQLIDPLTEADPSVDEWAVHQMRARLDLDRGRLTEAWDRVTAVRSVTPDNPIFRLEIETDALDIAIWRRRPQDATFRVPRLLTRVADSRESRETGALLTSAMRAYADLAERARARGDGKALLEAQAASEQIDAQHQAMRYDPFADHAGVAAASAENANWIAERARLAGSNPAHQAALWEVAVDAWNELLRPHRGAYALWRKAEALLADGQSAAATRELQLGASQALSMVPLLESIRELARRARIELDPYQREQAATEDLPYGLTARELDVLRQLIRGLTNAQIGAALFISAKTASVHVTHILQKLGVRGRLQAATLAQRAGIFDQDNEGD